MTRHFPGADPRACGSFPTLFAVLVQWIVGATHPPPRGPADSHHPLLAPTWRKDLAWSDLAWISELTHRVLAGFRLAKSARLELRGVAQPVAAPVLPTSRVLARFKGEKNDYRENTRDVGLVLSVLRLDCVMKRDLSGVVESVVGGSR
ncbi:hypothetical protein P4O66_004034 [Electrophorus voltai]|uniref:Uncharacterized protein n=1 Tax=Electrophorus voltai TaxID=2609070 RepID=A0AAD8ZPU1_9TELE|nr:hypothetical protein P4O66_004034 [Electrophorus voltai]